MSFRHQVDAQSLARQIATILEEIEKTTRLEVTDISFRRNGIFFDVCIDLTDSESGEQYSTGFCS